MNDNDRGLALVHTFTPLPGGCGLAETIDSDGRLGIWLVTPENGPPGSAESADHERIGRLPFRWRAKVAAAALRCGAPTRCGRPCRRPVAALGEHCHQHRKAS